MLQVTIENLKPTKKRMRIEIPKDEIDKKREEIVNELKARVNIKGFRRGKIPRNIVLKMYQKEIDEDAKRELMDYGYEFAISDKKIHAVSEPIFTDVIYNVDSKLSFNATVDVRPEFELRDYKNISVLKKNVEVTDDDIQKALEQVKEAFGVLEEKETETKSNDVVIFNVTAIDVETKKDIKELSGNKIYAELGKQQLIKEIEDNIIGMKRNETKTFHASFDEDYPIKSIRGKTLEFGVEIVSVKQKKLAEINDELAKKINKNLQNVEELKKDIKKRLRENKEKLEIERQKDELLEKLLNDYDFDLPESLVDKEANQMIVNYIKNMYYMGKDISKDEYKPRNLKEKFENDAKKRVKATFILLEIGNREKIDVSNDEIKQAIINEAQARNVNYETLYKEYEEKNLLNIIKMDILGDKVLDFLYENAQIIDDENLKIKESEMSL